MGHITDNKTPIPAFVKEHGRFAYLEGIILLYMYMSSIKKLDYELEISILRHLTRHSPNQLSHTEIESE